MYSIFLRSHHGCQEGTFVTWDQFFNSSSFTLLPSTSNYLEERRSSVLYARAAQTFQIVLVPLLRISSLFGSMERPTLYCVILNKTTCKYIKPTVNYGLNCFISIVSKFLSDETS